MELLNLSNDVYIIAAYRTPIGSFNGKFSKIPAATLGGIVIKSCYESVRLTGNDVSEVIMGQVLTTGQGLNPASCAARKANIPASVPATTVNMACGSGLKAVCLAYEAVKCNSVKLVICGGQENTSCAPHSMYLRGGGKIGTVKMKETLVVDGLTDKFTKLHLGKTGEHLAELYNISRTTQDIFAYKSIRNGVNAAEQNYFSSEIIPVEDIIQDEIVLDKADIKFENLVHSPTLFQVDQPRYPTITAANSAGFGDGAAALILCNGLHAGMMDVEPLAKIIAIAQVGISPLEMGIGLICSIEKVLETANWTKKDVDLYEIHESYAVHALVAIDKLGLDSNKVNITGGAIALGHPLGASGARMLVTLIYNLRRLDLSKGVVSVCTGGGLGIAVAIEVFKI